MGTSLWIFIYLRAGMVDHTYNSNSQEHKAGGLLQDHDELRLHFGYKEVILGYRMRPCLKAKKVIKMA